MYQYPTSSSFTRAGSFDLTRFQVITANGIVYLRTTLAKLTPTFGNVIMGAQLLDVYVHAAGAASTSTAAPFAPATTRSPWPTRGASALEVQGFMASLMWVDASGRQPGRHPDRGSGVHGLQDDHHRPARVGLRHPGLRLDLHPGAGRPGRLQRSTSPAVRRRHESRSPFSAFGVCASGGTEPICSAAHEHRGPPRSWTPHHPGPGVSQSTELNLTLGPGGPAGGHGARRQGLSVFVRQY